MYKLSLFVFVIGIEVVTPFVTSNNDPLEPFRRSVTNLTDMMDHLVRAMNVTQMKRFDSIRPGGEVDLLRQILDMGYAGVDKFSDNLVKLRTSIDSIPLTIKFLSQDLNRKLAELRPFDKDVNNVVQSLDNIKVIADELQSMHDSFDRVVDLGKVSYSEYRSDLDKIADGISRIQLAINKFVSMTEIIVEKHGDFEVYFSKLRVVIQKGFQSLELNSVSHVLNNLMSLFIGIISPENELRVHVSTLGIEVGLDRLVKKIEQVFSPADQIYGIEKGFKVNLNSDGLDNISKEIGAFTRLVKDFGDRKNEPDPVILGIVSKLEKIFSPVDEIYGQDLGFKVSINSEQLEKAVHGVSVMIEDLSRVVKQKSSTELSELAYRLEKIFSPPLDAIYGQEAGFRIIPGNLADVLMNMTSVIMGIAKTEHRIKHSHEFLALKEEKNSISRYKNEILRERLNEIVEVMKSTKETLDKLVSSGTFNISVDEKMLRLVVNDTVSMIFSNLFGGPVEVEFCHDSIHTNKTYCHKTRNRYARSFWNPLDWFEKALSSVFTALIKGVELLFEPFFTVLVKFVSIIMREIFRVFQELLKEIFKDIIFPLLKDWENIIKKFFEVILKIFKILLTLIIEFIFDLILEILGFIPLIVYDYILLVLGFYMVFKKFIFSLLLASVVFLKLLKKT